MDKQKKQEHNKKWKDNNKDKVKEYNALYYAANREKLLQAGKENYNANKDTILEKQKIWKHLNKDTINEKARIARADNIEEVLKTAKLWRKENKDKVSASNKKWNMKNPEKRKLHTITKLKRQEEIAGRTRPTVCEIPGCGGTYRISFDHCHATGKFRGWICGNCNTSLGLLKDDKIRLSGLIEYLGNFNDALSESTTVLQGVESSAQYQ